MICVSENRLIFIFNCSLNVRLCRKSYCPIFREGYKSTDNRGDIFYSYVSDTTHAAFGQVDSVYNTSKTLQEVYTYDEDFGRLMSQSNTQAGKTFTHSYTYDPFGRPETRTYPSGFEVEYRYTSNGDLDQVTGNGLTLWSCSDINALGQITSYGQGSYSTAVSYTNTGKLAGVTTGSIVDWDYGFDNLGNLAFRYDGISDQKEVFAYDSLNRLTDIEYYINSTHNTDGDLTIDFDDCGNIISKTGVSTDIDYGEDAGPHALTTINNPNASYVPPPQDITYNCFNKVASITDTLTGGIPLNIAFTYGLNNQRVRTTTTRNSTVERVKYFDIDYEEDSTAAGVKKYHYVHGGNGLSAIFVKQGTVNDTMFYVFSDHLGSLTTIVNASTSAVKRYGFNAWGMPRDASDWTSGYTGELFAARGYTGHEHLTEFNLINMNGRIYDPILGRFLSPDPFVQMPHYPNNFNRYTYAFNNPLKYTDPSGYQNYTFLDDPTTLIKEHSNREVIHPPGRWERAPNMYGGGGFGSGWNNKQFEADPYYGTYRDPETSQTFEIRFESVSGRYYYYDFYSLGRIVDENYNVHEGFGLRRVYIASNGGDPFSWVNRNSPLIEGSGSTLRGVGGEVGFDVLGERLMVGVHIFTNEYKSAYNGAWTHTHEKYSGFNLAFGPFNLQLRYNWTNGYFENGFGLSLVNIQQNSRPTLSGISGTAYLFGGISGGVNFDAGSLMQTATEVSNWYYKNAGTPWMVSFH